jgi:hypothetical protein
MFVMHRDNLYDGGVVETDKIKVTRKPSGKGFLMACTITTQITKRHAAWQHQQQTHHVTQEFLWGFLGIFQAHQYTLKQPHGAFSLQGEGGYATFMDYDPCGDPFINKTVRSIDNHYLVSDLRQSRRLEKGGTAQSG